MLNNIVRTRVIMDLLKDGSVTTEANYANTEVDYASVAIATKYVDAFCAYFGGPTEGNTEKATFYINCIRKYHRDIYTHGIKQSAATTASDDASSTVETDLGAEE